MEKETVKFECYTLGLNNFSLEQSTLPTTVALKHEHSPNPLAGN